MKNQTKKTNSCEQKYNQIQSSTTYQHYYKLLLNFFQIQGKHAQDFEKVMKKHMIETCKKSAKNMQGGGGKRTRSKRVRI